MNKPVNALFLTLMLAASIILLSHAPLGVQAASSSEYPMFQYDSSHSGSIPTAQTPSTTQWTYQIGASVVTSPAIARGMVSITSNTGLFTLRMDTGGFVRVYYIPCGASSPCYVDNGGNGLVCVCGNDGRIYAFDAFLGNIKWNYSIGGLTSSAPVVDSGVLYVGSPDGNLYALNATTGSKVWNSMTGGPVYSSPAVSGGLVYVGSADGNIYAFETLSGAQAWNYTLGGTVEADPCVADGTVYIGSSNGTVYALNASGGAKIWSHQIGSYPLLYPLSQSASVSTCPAVTGGIVYVSADDGYIYALNAFNGSEIWHFQTSGTGLDASPVIANGVVYVECVGAAKFYALNAATGSELVTYNLGGSSTAAIANGTVYVGSSNGTVYAFPIVTVPTPTPPPTQSSPSSSSSSSSSTSNPTSTGSPPKQSTPTPTATPLPTATPTPQQQTKDNPAEFAPPQYLYEALGIGLIVGAAALLAYAFMLKKKKTK
ncbi:MAG: PQQ-binding-like beta-propeller repeat protein [Candidatus Bathyarchaeota archaeon]|nr:PQQ-binding-like beta-propeller repeat protein [Candidatus Bathyarchaeota archaeon]